jgi:hypothetical protein
MDARLVGGGVAPGQSPSQLTPLGGTYKKTGCRLPQYRAGSSQNRSNPFGRLGRLRVKHCTCTHHQCTCDGDGDRKSCRKRR